MLNLVASLPKWQKEAVLCKSLLKASKEKAEDGTPALAWDLLQMKKRMVFIGDCQERYPFGMDGRKDWVGSRLHDGQ